MLAPGSISLNASFEVRTDKPQAAASSTALSRLPVSLKLMNMTPCYRTRLSPDEEQHRESELQSKALSLSQSAPRLLGIWRPPRRSELPRSALQSQRLLLEKQSCLDQDFVFLDGRNPSSREYDEFVLFLLVGAGLKNSVSIPWPVTSTFLEGKRKLRVDAVRSRHLFFSDRSFHVVLLCVYQSRLFLGKTASQKPAARTYSGHM